MAIITDALVLRVSDVGESDRVLTLLTADYGVIRAFANRAKKMNNKMQAATQSLSYGEFNIYSGKNSYIINSATVKEVFFGLRQDIEMLSLAQYFCSLAIDIIPEGEPAPQSLRVILNSLSFLQSGRRTARFLKAVTELKLISLAGYAPNLLKCASCSNDNISEATLDITKGRIYCQNCSHAGKKITPGVLTAMRHVSLSPVDRIYSFSLSERDEKLFAEVCETYLLSMTGKSYKTLEFYKSLSGD